MGSAQDGRGGSPTSLIFNHASIGSCPQRPSSFTVTNVCRRIMADIQTFPAYDLHTKFFLDVMTGKALAAIGDVDSSKQGISHTGTLFCGVLPVAFSPLPTDCRLE
eukprot:EG_transcript_59342